MEVKREVTMGDKGLAGQSHPKARLTDKEVDKIRDMYEQEMYSYSSLAVHFGVSKACIADICKYRRRTGVGYRSKTVCIDVSDLV